MNGTSWNGCLTFWMPKLSHCFAILPRAATKTKPTSSIKNKNPKNNALPKMVVFLTNLKSPNENTKVGQRLYIIIPKDSIFDGRSWVLWGTRVPANGFSYPSHKSTALLTPSNLSRPALRLCLICSAPSRDPFR